MNTKSHWENLYRTRQPEEVSWYQDYPGVSMDFVNELNIPKDAAIIDVGGGDSQFADHLLMQGYTNITILDISETALNRSRQRLGEAGVKITWVVADITGFSTPKKFDFWHDRATFHFLITEEMIARYLAVAASLLSPSGKIVIGTFSSEGPETCSGLPVKQYSEQTLSGLLSKWFTKIKCKTADHVTPLNVVQNFLFCSFVKSKNKNGLS